MEISINDKKAIDEIIEKVIREHLRQIGILRYVREIVVAEYHAWQKKHTPLILRVEKLEAQIAQIIIKANK